MILAILTFLLTKTPARLQNSGKTHSLVVYCAAGIRLPVEWIAKEYEKECGVSIQLHYGGSQTLLANIETSKQGDIFLPADESYIQLAREKQLIAETFPLAQVSPVICVQKGNPRGIRSLEDLWQKKVKIAQANAEATAIGKLTRDFFIKTGKWDALQGNTVVFKPTVNDVANDIRLGSADAGIVWDVTIQMYPDLEMIPAPTLTHLKANIEAAILGSTKSPVAALQFARYLGARDRGLKEFARYGYEIKEGDVWVLNPELVLYSGAMNRIAVESTIKQFEQREGARITSVYNGCGILVAQMKAGGRPDAYLTCDKSFVSPVGDLFPDIPIEISDSEIIILVRKNNPHEIRGLADLAKKGLRIGLANPEQSTLGALTRRLLEQGGILESVMTNVVTQTPTADLLVNQMRTGALDAVVVYISNTTKVRDLLDIVPINIPGSTAIQTYSIARNSQHKQLAGRLLKAIQSSESRKNYEQAGFHWRVTN